MGDIDRGVVTLSEIDMVIVHDIQDHTVSVDIYDKSNKRLAAVTTRLIK